ncbi:hypothetical protein ANN_03174 [Periplaneta americana]|uniref:Uncharacterized protein n=1 Tax=Periplaneta americana TaxID=6978 RepID=A0ABQ8TYA2_PERAM|nr:hypothetical protein ANN_03174 [Periplaneta americana]
MNRVMLDIVIQHYDLIILLRRTQRFKNEENMFNNDVPRLQSKSDVFPSFDNAIWQAARELSRITFLPFHGRINIRPYYPFLVTVPLSIHPVSPYQFVAYGTPYLVKSGIAEQVRVQVSQPYRRTGTSGILHTSYENRIRRLRNCIDIFIAPDCSKLETLGHVLGQCPKGELLINARHHRVRHALAISLKTLNWEIHEEVHCVSSDGSFRRADIIAINGRLKRALVLDLTIRFERNLNQATEVDIEKKSIYEPCLPYLSQKYNVPLK